MVHSKGYVAGWLDSSIHDFLGVFPKRSTSTQYALITCLDSNRKPSSLLQHSPELESVRHVAEPLGGGILLPTRRLLEANSRNRLLFGFDEIWFFPNHPVQPPPDAVSLVGPARITQAKLERLIGWMSNNSPSLALADGEGLNFLVKARGLVKHVIGLSLDQPACSGAYVAERAG